MAKIWDNSGYWDPMRGQTTDGQTIRTTVIPQGGSSGGTVDNSNSFAPPAGYGSWDAYIHGARGGGTYGGGSSGGGSSGGGGSGSGSSSSGSGSSGGGITSGSAGSGAFSLDGTGMRSGQVLSVTPNNPAGYQWTDPAERERYQHNLQIVLDRMKEMSDQANAANESRYQAMLGTADTMGTQARNRVTQQGVAAKAAANASAISRGLGNSTIRDSLTRGVQREVDDQLLGVDEAKARLKLGIMENRTDAPPDMGLYASLMGLPGALDWMAGQGSGSSGSSGSDGRGGSTLNWPALDGRLPTEPTARTVTRPNRQRWLGGMNGG